MPIHVGLEVPLYETKHYQLIRGQLEDRFKRLNLNGFFVEPQGMSITLCYLGNVSAPAMEKLEVLRSFASFYPKQEVILNGLGVAPSWEQGRNIWMSCRKTEALVTLQEMLQKTIQREDMVAEMKSFFPRINICQFSQPTNLKELFYGIPAMFTVVGVSAINIALYETDINNPGFVRVLKTFSLL